MKYKEKQPKNSAVFSLLLLCFKGITVNALTLCRLCLVSSDFNLVESAIILALTIVLALLNCAVNGLIGCVIHVFHLQN